MVLYNTKKKHILDTNFSPEEGIVIDGNGGEVATESKQDLNVTYQPPTPRTEQYPKADGNVKRNVTHAKKIVSLALLRYLQNLSQKSQTLPSYHRRRLSTLRTNQYSDTNTLNTPHQSILLKFPLLQTLTAQKPFQPNISIISRPKPKVTITSRSNLISKTPTCTRRK